MVGPLRPLPERSMWLCAVFVSVQASKLPAILKNSRSTFKRKVGQALVIYVEKPGGIYGLTIFAKTWASGRRNRFGWLKNLARKQAGSLIRQQERAAQYPRERSMAHLFHMEGQRQVRCCNCWLLLRSDLWVRWDLPPIHPCEILSAEFLKPLGISQYRLALSVHGPALRINEIVLEKRGITADTALRLSRFLGNSAEFWMNLQTSYERESARELSSRQIVHDIQPYVA